MSKICHSSCAAIIRQCCKLNFSERYFLSQSRPPVRQCNYLASSACLGDPHRKRLEICDDFKYRTSTFLSPNSSYQNVKIQTYASKGKGRRSTLFGEDDQETFSDDEDGEREEDDEFDDDDDEEVGPKTWKDLSVNASSLRIDAILSGGLGISRKKIEDAFLDARLKLNDKIISKKSKTVKPGDVVDVVLKEKHHNTEDNIPSNAVMRVKVLRISEEVTSKERVPVKLRRWKYLKV